MFIPLQYHSNGIRYTETETDTETILKSTRNLESETRNSKPERDTITFRQAGKPSSLYGVNCKAYEEGNSSQALNQEDQSPIPSLKQVCPWEKREPSNLTANQLTNEIGDMRTQSGQNRTRFICYVSSNFKYENNLCGFASFASSGTLGFNP